MLDDFDVKQALYLLGLRGEVAVVGQPGWYTVEMVAQTVYGVDWTVNLPPGKLSSVARWLHRLLERGEVRAKRHGRATGRPTAYLWTVGPEEWFTGQMGGPDQHLHEVEGPGAVATVRPLSKDQVV